MRKPIALLELEIQELFDAAKSLRDEGRYSDGVAKLESALGLLRDAGWEGVNEDSEDAIAAPTLFAEAFGMMGGQLRRAGSHDAALQAYERGREYEERSDTPSSYNAVNVIVSKLQSGQWTRETVREDLERAIRLLQRQTRGVRARDVWAWSDLGRCRMLAGDLDGSEDAYRRMIKLWVPDAMDTDPIDSELSTLESLRGVLEQTDEEGARLVAGAIEFLREAAGR